MSETVTLEVTSSEQAALAAALSCFLQEMEQLALAARGHIFDVCEAAALKKGQDVNRQVLQQAVQSGINALEKKGPLCGPAMRSTPGKPPYGPALGHELPRRCASPAPLVGQPLWLHRRGLPSGRGLGLDGHYTRALQHT